LMFTMKCLFSSCSPRRLDSSSNNRKPKRVLFVIAHPDDECMFFGPTIINYIKASRRQVYVLCLSSGNYEGVGKVRKKELWSSCRALGILTSNITLHQYDKLKDDPNLEWNNVVVSRAIVDHVQAYDIETVITFDEYGISGHKNHSAIHKAIVHLIDHKQWPTRCQVLVLESVNVFRKYMMSFCDLAVSYCSSEITYYVDIYQRASIVAAMECHKTQMLWYRRLYLIFSRYILINTLSEIYEAKAASGSVKDFETAKVKDE